MIKHPAAKVMHGLLKQLHHNPVSITNHVLLIERPGHRLWKKNPSSPFLWIISCKTLENKAAESEEARPPAACGPRRWSHAACMWSACSLQTAARSAFYNKLQFNKCVCVSVHQSLCSLCVSTSSAFYLTNPNHQYISDCDL